MGHFHSGHPGWHGGYRRGGSRILWFALGAVAATWHFKAKEHTHRDGFGCTWQHRRELEALRAAGAGEAPPRELEALRASPSPERERWRFSARWGQPAADTSLPPPSALEPLAVPSASASLPPAFADLNKVQQEGWTREDAIKAAEAAADRWAAEQERLHQLTKQAEEKVTDFSETTLDSILSTVQGLKTKLAEHRKQQALQQKREQELAEEARKHPPRWV